ncbi:MAG: hypothetical protein QF872_01805, partial [Gammaproteobacteria bacterium]|nr:hypothetical protein [Gammaproteobacteria bacterium]
MATSQTVALSKGEQLVLDGDLIIANDGRFIGASESSIRVSGNWENNGTYIHGDGTVYFTGATTSQIKGDNTFHSLVADFAEADTSSGKILQLAASSTQTITDLLQVKGDSNTDLKLHASTEGVSATLNLKGATVVVRDIDVKDNRVINSGGTAIDPPDSIDSGNTLGWFSASPQQTSFEQKIVLAKILESSASPEGKNNANGTQISLDQLKKVANKVQSNLLTHYQAAIAAETGFSNPPTFKQIQTIVDRVNQANGVKEIYTPWNYTVEFGASVVISELQQYAQGLTNLIVTKDVGEGIIGSTVSEFVDLSPDDSVSFTAGHQELGSDNGILQVDEDETTLEGYIDVDGDDKPDYLWSPAKQTLEKVTLNIVGIQLGSVAGNNNQIVKAAVSYPKGHAKAITGISSRPVLVLEGPAKHLFRLWAYSGGQFGPVTGDIAIPASGSITLKASDYTKSIDIGDNQILMRGSVSLPVPLVVSGDIAIDMTANRKEASVGNTVVYSVSLENISNVAQSNIGVTNILPSGFRYVDGSARYDGVAVLPEKIGGTGLHFDIGNLEISGKHTLQYQLAVGSGVNFGTYTNTVVAVDTLATMDRSDDMALSSQAQAGVKVVPDALFDLATIIGKVYHDRNGDGQQNEGEQPVATARLLTSAGQQIQVDSNGQ